MLASLNRFAFSFFFVITMLLGCGSGVLQASGASPASVSVAGSPVVNLGVPTQYAASLSGVTWSIKGTSSSENYGTISASGVYSPPAVVPVHNVISIVATSITDPTKSSATAVTITNPVPSVLSTSSKATPHNTFLVTVTGGNFMPSSVVVYNGYGVATTYLDSAHLQFTVTAAPLSGTSVPIGVINPAPGRTASPNFGFTVPTALSVAVSGSAQTNIGVSSQFSASVSGTDNTGVTWSVAGTSATENYGTISASGLYTPPATVPTHNVISIVATSVVDPTKTASATTTLSNPVPAIKTASFTAGSKGTFVVDVLGSNFMPSSVVLYGGYGAGTTYLSPTHLQFTITNNPATGSTIALGVINPAPGRTQSANFNAKVASVVGVALAGDSTVFVTKPSQFLATVTGTSNTAVTWSINGVSAAENYGTISSGGVYTPPGTVPVHGTVNIVATSVADPTKSASVSVSLSNPVPTIQTASLTAGNKGTLLVDVVGSNFLPTSVLTYAGSGVSTTYVSPTHLQFTITSNPAAGSTAVLGVINPAPGRTQSANFNAIIPGAIAVALNGDSTAFVGKPAQFAASVTGTSNNAVTWSIKGTSASENYGTISSTGLYTPPTSVPVHPAISIVATSAADTTKSASVAVSLSNPVPVIQTATLTAGTKSSYLVDVVGSNFMSSSVLTYGGYGVATTYVSPTHLQFTITSNPAAGSTAVLGVINPAPGRTQSANFNATIPGAIAITLAGDTTALVSKAVQYTATVTGTSNSAVTWAVKGASASEDYGTVSSSGLYTPPSSVPVHSVVTIVATSVADTTKTASVNIALANQTPVITAATSATSGKYIALNITGQYFIPTSQVQLQGFSIPTTYVSPTSLTATIPTAQTAGAQVPIYVIAPSPGMAKSAAYTVQLPGKVGVTVAGSSQLAAGNTAQYAAVVTGTTNTAVTWSVVAPSGGDAGTISSTGLYTPPTTVSANLPVTIIAASQEQPASQGTTSVLVTGVSAASAARLLDQSTFGPTSDLVAHVQTIGLSNFIDEQLATPPTLLPRTDSLPSWCSSNPAVCQDEYWWSNVVAGPDQLRQRVSMALLQMLVVSYGESNVTQVANYSNIMTTDAFANWSTIMKDMTLSPAMGRYLNMVNSGKPKAGTIANENFARENMQLFNLGLNLLNEDGTLQTDSSGNPIPTYTEAQVEAFARAFTGWTYATPDGSAPSFPSWNANNYAQMVAVDSAHDTSSKVLLNTTLPAGQSAAQDLDAAIQDVFHHPNAGPFIVRQLIQHLVKSNPTPGYVGRIAAVFANDGTGVRGNMAAVIKALLLDPEARAGDTGETPTDGYLREPLLWTANILRALNAVPKAGYNDFTAYTAIDTFGTSQGQKVFSAPTVFNFYPAEWKLMNTGLNAPQFALETSATIMQKLTLCSNVVNNMLGRLTIDLSATGPLGQLAVASNDVLLQQLNNLFLHGQMSSQMKTTILNAISGTSDPAQRVRTAVYLVISSPQYRVVH